MADDSWIAPEMRMIARGVVVQRPAAELVAAKSEPLGALSIGAGHLPTVGPVVHLSVHHPDGTVLVATLGAQAFRDVAVQFNAAGDRIARGDYALPETKQ